jgi:hypothetical protein
MANDGNAATFWQADASDTNAWVMIDLERNVTVRSVKLTFPYEVSRRFRVEISDDGNSGWKLISDQMATVSTATTQTLSAASGGRGRFLRVGFTGTPDGKPAALAEIRALGNLYGQ